MSEEIPMTVQRIEYGEDTVVVDLWYPRSKEIKYVEVGLVDVRAADSIRVSYDYDRDGYRIEQASRFSWSADEEPDPDWQEVAFIQAWNREEDNDGDDGRIG